MLNPVFEEKCNRKHILFALLILGQAFPISKYLFPPKAMCSSYDKWLLIAFDEPTLHYCTKKCQIVFGKM